MYKLTIVTVCLNSERTIKDTLESIKKQKNQDFEYVVVDGGSVDKTLGILKSYSNFFGDRLKVISESDQGLYDAMNKGIRLSSGEYIGILNSDDKFFSSNVIENVIDELNNNPVDALIGNVQIEKKGSVKRQYSSKKWSPGKLKYGFMPPHPAIFLKRSLFEKYGTYSTDYEIAADYELLIRLFLKNRITYSYFDLTTTVMSASGLSDKGFASYKIITKEILKGFKDNEIKCSKLPVYFRFLHKINEIKIWKNVESL